MTDIVITSQGSVAGHGEAYGLGAPANAAGRGAHAARERAVMPAVETHGPDPGASIIFYLYVNFV